MVRTAARRLLVSRVLALGVLACGSRQPAYQRTLKCGLPNVTDFSSNNDMAQSLQLFAHIPQSGGTAWSWHLKSVYHPSEIVPGSEVAGRFQLPNGCARCKTKRLQSLIPAANRTFRVLFGHSRTSLLKEIGVQPPWHTTTFLRDAAELALAQGPDRSAITKILAYACGQNESVALSREANQMAQILIAYPYYREHGELRRHCTLGRAIRTASSMTHQQRRATPGESNSQSFGRQLFGMEVADRQRSQRRSWLSWLVPTTAVPLVDPKANDDEPCRLFTRAASAVTETVWFGLTSHWVVRPFDNEKFAF